MEAAELLQVALGAMKNAYAPYSKFPVGAAVLTRNGKVYTGCNVENASSGLTVCAERTAIFKAVSEGEQEFSSIAVVADTDSYCSPCGACRQVIAEFGSDILVIMGNRHGEYQSKQISQLLPDHFTFETNNEKS
ncbi:MAG: cytidine deaminase [Bacillota bacterium]